MQVIGLICEYNPFHYGHLYHIKKIKQLYRNSLLILCLNGPFLERGDISVLPIEEKTKIALNYGIDLVILLPTLYGCQSADNFALASTTLLNALGVDKIIFGSETNNINSLMEIAKRQTETEISLSLEDKNNYPTRLMKTLNIEHIKPNDLLGISYCKAILNLNSKIELETIKRTNNFHDVASTHHIVSAQNIRKKWLNNNDISSYLPNISKINMTKANEQIYYQMLTSLILSSNLEEILDVTEGIENLLKKKIMESKTLSIFLEKIKSKRYTYNRLKRMLIHILLGIKKNDALQKITYIHILGFNSLGKQYIHQKKKAFSLPITIDKKSYIYNLELKAAYFYDLFCHTSTYEFLKKNKPIYLDTSNFPNSSNQK